MTRTIAGPAIAVDRATTGYRSWGRKRPVLHDLSIVARPGAVTALVGPNGAGKTTLLRVLMGFLPLWKGHASVGGMAPASYRAGHGAAYLPESVTLPSGWNLQGFLRLAGHMSGLAPSTWPEAVEEALSSVGLPGMASARLSALSRGQARRATLAFALLGEPRLVILDEPWTHLDPRGRASLGTCVEGLRDRGTTVVLSSHELAEVTRVADVVHVMVDGTVTGSFIGGVAGAEALRRAVLGGGGP